MSVEETPENPNGPWRILLLDRGLDDPMWLIVTVGIPSDVQPAALEPDGRYRNWAEVAQWVRAQVGHAVSLVPIAGPLAWTIHARTRGDVRIVPSVRAMFGARWMIELRDDGAWIAERRMDGNKVRVVAADSEAELIEKLTEVESGEQS